jgi:hypothetical protein
MSEPFVAAVLADVLTERGDQLHQLAALLRAYTPSDQLPPHRVLVLSGQLLAQLGDVERAAHELARWFPSARARRRETAA